MGLILGGVLSNLVPVAIEASIQKITIPVLVTKVPQTPSITLTLAIILILTVAITPLR